MPDHRGHGQDTLDDADGHTFVGAAAVVFEVELALDGVVHRLDQLADLLEHRLAVAGLFVLASQVRTATAPRAMASLRNLAIALIRLMGWAYIPDAHDHYHAHPTDAAYLVGLTM